MAHEESAQEGQTEAPPREDAVNLHFVCFVEKEGHLYELGALCCAIFVFHVCCSLLRAADGNKAGPVNHGETTPENLLQDAATVVKDKFMARNPEELRFTLVALAKA